MSSRLLQDLPAIYSDDAFAGRFLLAFEKLLLGIGDGVALPATGACFPQAGLEESIDGLAHYFDADLAPQEFLPWLSSWVALSLRADLDVAVHRRFLANIMERYRLRGTVANLQELLQTFTVGRPDISEDAAPHSFTVTIYLPPPSAFEGNAEEYVAFIDRQTEIARALIELEKPAHTRFTLIPVFPSLQIGVHSTVGIDTLLGTARYE